MPPILVTGSHRSGTGWVGQVLAGHVLAPAFVPAQLDQRGDVVDDIRERRALTATIAVIRIRLTAYCAEEAAALSAVLGYRQRGARPHRKAG